METKEIKIVDSGIWFIVFIITFAINSYFIYSAIDRNTEAVKSEIIWKTCSELVDKNYHVIINGQYLNCDIH